MDDREIPGWESVKSQAKSWANKFVKLKKDLYAAREDVKWMRNQLAKYPAKLTAHAAAIADLDKDQKAQESKFFGFERKLLSLMDYLGISIPGLSGDLGVIPVVWAVGSALVFLATAGAIYYGVTAHLSAVSRERALIAKLTPADARKELDAMRARPGLFAEAKNLIYLGIAAVILVPLISKRI